MKTKIKRILSVMLVFVMMMGMIPNMAMDAHAASTDPTVRVGGTTISNVSGTASGTGWEYDGRNSYINITLNNYSGNGIHITDLAESKRVIINVYGNCTINSSTLPAIWMKSANVDASNIVTELEIRLQKGASLTIDGNYGIYNESYNPKLILSSPAGASGQLSIKASTAAIKNAGAGNSDSGYSGTLNIEGPIAVNVDGKCDIGWRATGNNVTQYPHQPLLYVYDGANAYFKTEEGRAAFVGYNTYAGNYPSLELAEGYKQDVMESGRILHIYKPASYSIGFDGSNTLIPNAETGTNGKLTSLPTPTAPNPGSVFEGWYSLEDGGYKVTTDTVFTSSTIVYARWKYAVTVSADSEDHGTVNIYPVREYYEKGEEVIVGAFPKEGYTFKEWQENGTPVSTQKNYSFVVKNNCNLVAVFEAEGGSVTPPATTYNITVSADSEDRGTVNIYPVRESYEKGEEVIVGAFPKEGYTFKEWQENGTPVSTQKNYSFVVENNRDLVAVFEAEGGSVTPPEDDDNTIINSVNLTGFVVPAADDTASTKPTATAESGKGYGVRTTRWCDAEGVQISASTVFEGGKTYYANLVLQANEGYEFTPTGLNATVNGGAVTVEKVSVENYYDVNDKAEVVVKFTIPAAEGGETPAPAPTVSIPESLALKVGESSTLTATGEYEGYTLVWSSDNEAVATVDENGKVTAVATGTANITVTLDAGATRTTISDTCVVTVTEADVPACNHPEDKLELKFETEEGHWSECKCGQYRSDVVPHEFDNDEDVACDCGYEREIGDVEPEHEHNWVEDWNKNDTHHWHECHANTECPVTENSEKDGYEKHEYVDGVCVCGAEKPAEDPTKPVYGITVNNGKSYTGAGVETSAAEEGTKITLKADAAPEGKVFDKWVVNNGTITLADATKAETTFDMPAERVQVTATYKDAPVADDDTDDNKPGDDENKPGDEDKKPSDDKKPTTDTESPKTGDTANIFMWFAVLLVSGFGLAAVLFTKRRRA